MRRYLLAIEIEPVEQGAKYASLPLHCTLMHWFMTTLEPKEIARAIATTLVHEQQPELISGASALYGEQLDRPVHTIVPNERLSALHMTTHATLSGLGVVYTKPAYVGVGYHPHVTDRADRSFPSGSRKLVERIYLAEALAEIPKTRRIAAIIPLPVTTQ